MGLLGPMEGQSCNAWSVTVSYCSSGGKSSPLGSPSHPPTHLGIARPSFALLNLPWSCPLVNCLTFDGENTTESARPCMQNCLQYLNGILFLWNFASTLHTIDLRRRENPKKSTMSTRPCTRNLLDSCTTPLLACKPSMNHEFPSTNLADSHKSGSTMHDAHPRRKLAVCPWGFTSLTPHQACSTLSLPAEFARGNPCLKSLQNLSRNPWSILPLIAEKSREIASFILANCLPFTTRNSSSNLAGILPEVRVPPDWWELGPCNFVIWVFGQF